MKQIKLLWLKLTYFKGIREYTFTPDGHDADVFGDNATGKTTLEDAFMWLLFGKDSLGSSVFEIKTLENGVPIPGVDHVVEAGLLIDGEKHVLKRTYREVWTKKRGEKTSALTSHSTEYEIDGVRPMKEMEYAAAVASLVGSEALFKLLTNVRWFNEQLDWKKKRETLFAFGREPSFADMLVAEPRLSELPDALGERSAAVHDAKKLDQWRVGAATRRNEIKAAQNALPLRIDEATKAMPPAPSSDYQSSERRVKVLTAEIDALLVKRAQTTADSVSASRRVDLQKLEAALLKEQNKAQGASLRAAGEKRGMLMDLQSLRADLVQVVASVERAVKLNEGTHARLTPDLEALRRRWLERNAETFAHTSRNTCPTCGQPLPEEQIEEARQKALDEFNMRKANDLAGIDAQGQRLVGEIGKLNADIDRQKRAIEEQQPKIEQLDEQIKAVQAEIAEIGKVQPADTPEMAEIREQITKITAIINAGEQSVAGQIALIDGEIKAKSEEVKKLADDIRTWDQRQTQTKRIETLKTEQQHLSAELDALERAFWLSDLFITTRVKLFEEAINGRFSIVRFKLFDVQINGGISECCETTVNGVPYGSLNNGARINAGLDILNALAEHYQTAVPVWIDNAEAVTQPLQTVGQQIRLYVHEGAATLSVRLCDGGQ